MILITFSEENSSHNHIQNRSNPIRFSFKSIPRCQESSWYPLATYSAVNQLASTDLTHRRKPRKTVQLRKSTQNSNEDPRLRHWTRLRSRNKGRSTFFLLVLASIISQCKMLIAPPVLNPPIPDRAFVPCSIKPDVSFLPQEMTNRFSLAQRKSTRGRSSLRSSLGGAKRRRKSSS